MKKLFTFENIRITAWIIGGIITASYFVFNVKADVSNLDKRICSQEKQMNEIKVKNENNEKRIIVIETKIDSILKGQNDMSTDIKTLLARR